MPALGTAQHGFPFLESRPPLLPVDLLLKFLLTFITEPPVTIGRYPEFHIIFLDP